MAKLKSKLPEYIGGIDRAVRQLAIHETANQILLLTKIFAPVETGFLRDSYEKEEVSKLSIVIGTMVNYAVFQEYGTYRMTAQPHLTPAFKQSEIIFRKKLSDAVKELTR